MIRGYRDEDCKALIETWYTASQVATPFPSEGFLAEEREAIRKFYLPRAETWVFETEGTVAGFITLLGTGRPVAHSIARDTSFVTKTPQKHLYYCLSL